LNRYPEPYRFAFTIVQDADSAFSARLSPLFDVFDELGSRITASAFAFWADWARDGAIWSEWRASPFDAPIAVPLCDPVEGLFYQQLSARGHEIALHSPADTSSTSQQVADAFELYRTMFGRYPATYVEHSARSNKDALANEGARPGSPYFTRDLLRRYDPWTWVDDEHGLRDTRDGHGLLNDAANAQYGLKKAFIRTGRWSASDGDGFLAYYSEDRVDALERDAGAALVYTHLNEGWLDPRTRRMRHDLVERLSYIAAKPGWFVPASEILDRVVAVPA
jgi:hypothetical protein